MSWTKVGGGNGNLIKWEAKGQAYEGLIRAIRKGRDFGQGATLLCDISQSDGKGDVTVPLTTALRNRFAESNIAAGMEVRIEYQGVGKTKGGNQIKLFDVYTRGPAGEPSLAMPAVTLTLAQKEQKVLLLKGAAGQQMLDIIKRVSGNDQAAYEKAIDEIL